MTTLNKLQEELKVWQEHNFPTRTWNNPFMGVVEEVGELSHHLLKQNQKIRGTSESHEEGIKDSVGDILVFLADFCNARGYDLQNILDVTWDEVKKRDWQKNNKDGK